MTTARHVEARGELEQRSRPVDAGQKPGHGECALGQRDHLVEEVPLHEVSPGRSEVAHRGLSAGALQEAEETWGMWDKITETVIHSLSPQSSDVQWFTVDSQFRSLPELSALHPTLPLSQAEAGELANLLSELETARTRLRGALEERRSDEVILAARSGRSAASNVRRVLRAELEFLVVGGV